MKKMFSFLLAVVGALGALAADRCLIIPKDTTFVVDSSAADYQEKLDIMSTNEFLHVDNGAVVEFNLDSTVDLTLDTRITACYSSTQHSGKLVKKGAGILRFETARKSSNDYNLDIDVQAGELHLPEKYDISTQYGQNINVAAGAVYATSTNNVYTFDRLTGAGTVIGFGNFIIREDCEFAGDIHMAVYRTVQAWKHFKMSGTGCTYKGSSHLIANNVLENGVFTSRGIIELASPSAFPNSGDQDFWTQDTGGEFRLHGDPETAWTYAHRLDVRACGNRGIPRCDAVRDEGLATVSAVTGNFTWSTGWRFAYGSDYPNGMPGVWYFTLTGDNTEYPATFSGYISEASSATTGNRNIWALRKRGTGIWQIKKNNSTKWSGPLFVENGTLQYDTLAAAGVNCALGFATNLYKPTWTNVYEDLGYAIGVGCATNLAWTGLLEYTGSTVVPMTTRPVRVLGAGGFKSGAVDTDWSDITAENDNSTLVLAGSGTGDNVVRDLDDGDGRLSIRKEGTGTWRLAEPVTATGDIAVNGGKLLLNNGKGVTYSWYRFIVKENGIVCPRYEAEHELMPTNSAAEFKICTFYQFCFYDKDGNQIMTDSNMTLLDSIPATATTLQRGEYSFDPEHTPNNPSATYSQLQDCFRGSGSFSLNSGTGNEFDIDGESTWGGLVWRLPEGAADPVSMDFLDVQGLSRNTDGKATSGARCVTAWRLQGSVDGDRWETILDKDDQDIPPKSMSWGSNLAYVDQKHDCYALPNIISAGIDDYLENPGTLSVAAGATLEVFGVLPFDSLSLDVKNGAGTFNGVTFAESGTVDLVGGKTDVSATFVDSPTVSNVANWAVTRNGKATAYRLAVTEKGFRVVKPGLAVIVR